MNSKLKELEVENLFEAILCLENMEECYNFFEDLCTVTELKALSQRFQVAKMLDSGKVYSDIVATTGASTATISRVNRSLNYGCDGYRVPVSYTHLGESPPGPGEDRRAGEPDRY